MCLGRGSLDLDLVHDILDATDTAGDGERVVGVGELGHVATQRGDTVAHVDLELEVGRRRILGERTADTFGERLIAGATGLSERPLAHHGIGRREIGFRLLDRLRRVVLHRLLERLLVTRIAIASAIDHVRAARRARATTFMGAAGTQA